MGVKPTTYLLRMIVHGHISLADVKKIKEMVKAYLEQSKYKIDSIDLD